MALISGEKEVMLFRVSYNASILCSLVLSIAQYFFFLVLNSVSLLTANYFVSTKKNTTVISRELWKKSTETVPHNDSEN